MKHNSLKKEDIFSGFNTINIIFEFAPKCFFKYSAQVPCLCSGLFLRL